MKQLPNTTSVDAAALATSALAGALAVFIEPGPFDEMSIVTGITISSVIICFQGARKRNLAESWAFATVISFVLLLIFGAVFEFILGNGSFEGYCPFKKRPCSPDEFQSRVSQVSLSVSWFVSTIVVFVLDIIFQKNHHNEAWAEEVESRFDAFECGELKESPVDDVFARIKNLKDNG